MKHLIFVFFTFFIVPYAGANVTKQRLSNDVYRISLTGPDAESLMANIGERYITTPSPLKSISCLQVPQRCEINVKVVDVQSHESIQEQLRQMNELGMKTPQGRFTHNSSEQLLTARVDEAAAKHLYNLLPGPEVDFNLDHSVAEQFSGKTKSLELAHGDFFMACQKLERTSTAKYPYSCLVSAIVPVQNE